MCGKQVQSEGDEGREGQCASINATQQTVYAGARAVRRTASILH